ncbi:50S ribosomal protein L11 methyltransferase [Desulfurivibrio alkaliphilus]|uniref:Ribosomal protein L11 methyltransferase n=1 Tax=Desulfurivibrio alkaliphilus (strain DSM 19089 / UNIQEM U267 / AHT2) TaxID=589865 RepID=D6Z0J9_DESAT|nr:50S ribosomal protein L11 methyltransferase [Desulfurivibrio alkaliphilus]ADH85228.1 ribosomal protein L11 methyltransferase [Desulfurivibrio alkaliphilus AHT 2]
MTNTPRSWLKLTVQCPPEQADNVAAMLASCSAGGVEHGFTGFDHDSPWEEISVYLEQDDSLNDCLQAINDYLEYLRSHHQAVEIPPPRTEVIVDRDWNATWKKEFTPLAVAPGLIIKPTWETYEPAPGEQVIEMDPGQAFGTGHHASTRLALHLLNLLFSEAEPPATVLDAGCGTGILAMAAALWGAEKVVAIDNDPLAVEATRFNSERNQLNSVIQTSQTPLPELTSPFQAVLANITADVLLDLAPELVRLVAPGGHLILAGVLTGQQEAEIVRHFQELGLLLRQQPHQDEWVAFLFRKPHDAQS